MTIWITQEPPCFIFEHLDILRDSIRHPSKTLLSFDFSESLRVQFWASRFIMHRNWRSKLKVMTIQISWELPWCIFKRLELSWATDIHPNKKLSLFEFLESFMLSFKRLDILCVWIGDRVKCYDIWISRELPLIIFECLDISWASQIHPSQKLWPFEFAESLRVQFRASRYIIRQNQRSNWKVMTIQISWELPWFIF